MTNPKVFLGNPVTGYGGDSSRKAFAKYNSHYHQNAFSEGFLYEPLRLGDSVALYIEGEDVLTYTGVPNSPTILGITNDHLEVSTQATKSGVGELVVNGMRFSDVVATEGSSHLARLEDRAGFITPSTLRSALTHSFTGTALIDTSIQTILDPQNVSDLMAVLGQAPLSLPVQSTPILLSAPFRFRVQAIHLLPQWTVNYVDRAAAVRIARNGDTFGYLSEVITLNQTGRVKISLNSLSVEQDDAVYIQIFNPLNLARLSYQLDVIAV